MSLWRLLNSFSNYNLWVEIEVNTIEYLENHVRHVSSLLEAITFDSTIGFSIALVFWKLDIHTFLRTPRLAQSNSGKASRYAIEVRREKR